MQKLSLLTAALLVAGSIGSVNAASSKAEENRAPIAQTKSQAGVTPNRGTLRSLDVRNGQQGERASQGKANKGGNVLY